MWTWSRSCCVLSAGSFHDARALKANKAKRRETTATTKTSMRPKWPLGWECYLLLRTLFWTLKVLPPLFSGICEMSFSVQQAHTEAENCCIIYPAHVFIIYPASSTGPVLFMNYFSNSWEPILNLSSFSTHWIITSLKNLWHLMLCVF